MKVELPSIEDPFGALEHFNERIASLARNTASEHVRVGVYGDSNMTMDWITSGMRRLLQGKYGDGGHGYVALGRPWGWYQHNDVRHDSPAAHWKFCAISTHPCDDGHYGFANIAAESSEAGAYSWVATAPEGAAIGKTVSRATLYYLKQPGGGRIRLKIDRKEERLVSTRGGRHEAAFESIEVPDGAHKFEFLTLGDGPARLFGLTLERDPPSVIVDSLGAGALNYEQMLRVKQASRGAMLKERRYDLVVFLLGTNLFSPNQHAAWIKRLFDQYRRALPRASLLMLSPPDLELTQDAKASDPRIVKLVDQLRAIAKEEHVAFWDFRAAMGGDLSMRHFAKHHLATWDLIHFTEPGGRLMGQRFAHALMNGVRQHVEHHPEAGCREALARREAAQAAYR